MSHHEQEFARTPASLLIEPSTRRDLLRSDTHGAEKETRVIVKGQGVLCAAFRGQEKQPFAFLIQDDMRLNGFRLSVEDDGASFEQQRNGEWEACKNASIQDCSGLDADDGCVYWFSVDSHNRLLRYGKGEVRKNTLLAELGFSLQPAEETAWVSAVSVICTTAEPVKIYRDPVIADPAMYVVATDKISMEQVARNTATVAGNLTPIHPSFQFLAKPHTDHEPGIVTGRATASGSVADLFFGASNDQSDCLYPRLALVTIIRTFW